MTLWLLGTGPLHPNQCCEKGLEQVEKTLKGVGMALLHWPKK